MEEKRKRFLLRGGLVAGIVCVLVGAILVPAFGGPGFLTKKKANKLYLKKSDAGNFLPKSAGGQFLPSSAGVSTAVASSTSLPGFQSSSQTAVDIPGATASVNVPSGNAILMATFNGSSLCTNNTAGFNCPIQITVDGATANPTPDSSGYIWDTTLPPASAPDKALSLTVSKQVSAGTHSVKVTFGGAGVAGTTFTLRTWHLTVQSFPG
ncbi:MAG TPA: hypothetical protein VH329_02720 [Solirubrobacterales bacterium]